MSLRTDNNDDHSHTRYKVTKKYSHWIEFCFVLTIQLTCINTINGNETSLGTVNI